MLLYSALVLFRKLASWLCVCVEKIRKIRFDRFTFFSHFIKKSSPCPLLLGIYCSVITFHLGCNRVVFFIVFFHFIRFPQHHFSIYAAKYWFSNSLPHSYTFFSLSSHCTWSTSSRFVNILIFQVHDRKTHLECDVNPMGKQRANKREKKNRWTLIETRKRIKFEMIFFVGFNKMRLLPFFLFFANIKSTRE